MARSEFVEPVSAWFWKPLLIWVSCLVPLNYFCSIVSFLFCNIQGISIQNALNNNSFSLLYKSPSLIPSFVLLPLNKSFTFFPGCPRDIKCFSWKVIDYNSTALNCGVWDKLESEKLRLVVGIKFTISQNTF